MLSGLQNFDSWWTLNNIMPSMHHVNTIEPYKSQISGGGENGLQFVSTGGELFQKQWNSGANGGSMKELHCKTLSFWVVRFAIFILNHL